MQDLHIPKGPPTTGKRPGTQKGGPTFSSELSLCRFPAHARANSWQMPELNRSSEVHFLALQGCLLPAGPQVISGRHAKSPPQPTPPPLRRGRQEWTLSIKLPTLGLFQDNDCPFPARQCWCSSQFRILKQAANTHMEKALWHQRLKVKSLKAHDRNDRGPFASTPLFLSITSKALACS